MAKLNRGALVIGVIFGTAMVMAGFAVWWQYQLQQQSLVFWGRDRAMLIRHAPQIDLLRLEPATETRTESNTVPGGANSDSVSPNTVTDGETAYEIVEQKDMSRADGMLHARHSLIEDNSFRWGEAPTQPAPPWRFAFRFIRGDESTVVFFDEGCQYVGSDDQQVVALTPQISAGLRKYTAGRFP